MRDLNSDLKALSTSWWLEALKIAQKIIRKNDLEHKRKKPGLILILFVYKLMIGSSKNSTENYPKKWFGTQEKETQVNFNPELSANRPSNNSAQFSTAHDYRPGMSFPLAS